MLAYLAPVLVFGVVIFVHEFGHFLAAKAVGVYAPRFSIGFGPAIIRFRRGETEYVLAWLPLGGYVRMASRHDAETAFLEGGSEEETARKEEDAGYDPNAMIPFGPKPVPEDRWFESKPLWARLIIMIAGVVMNTLLAFVVATGLVMYEGQNVVRSTVVGSVHPTATTQALAQLHGGDTIRSVNGATVSTWNDVQKQIMTSSNEVRFVTQRGEVRVPLAGGATAARDVGEAVVFFMPSVIDSIVPGDPAAKAGLLRGDSVVAIDGAPVGSWSDIVDRVTVAPLKRLEFVIVRAGKLDSLAITPRSAEEPDRATKETRTVGKIGAAAKTPVVHTSLSFAASVSGGFEMTARGASIVFKALHDIGSGAQPVSQLGGPIAITRAAVSAGQDGFASVMYLLILLSINVAIFNLLPIPILDGGQILINVLESAKGSPFTMRTREYILRFGLAVIAVLFVIVMYNDTREGFVKLFGWVGRLFGA